MASKHGMYWGDGNDDSETEQNSVLVHEQQH